MKWYIGQEIVCIKTHSKGIVKKGESYFIKGLQKANCTCGYIEIDVGIQKFSHQYCKRCGFRKPEPTLIFWFNESLFAPLDFDISELTDILEQPKEIINN